MHRKHMLRIVVQARHREYERPGQGNARLLLCEGLYPRQTLKPAAGLTFLCFWQHANDETDRRQALYSLAAPIAVALALTDCVDRLRGATHAQSMCISLLSPSLNA